MKKYLALTLLACSGLAPIAARAAAVQYSLTFTAQLGPSGTGSTYFDAATGLLTGFSWNFGPGAMGGVTDAGWLGTTLGDTTGRFVFEILSQTDVHSGINCLAPSICGMGPSPSETSGAPAGGYSFNVSSFQLNGASPPGSTYSFTNINSQQVARGTVYVTAVPEPGSLALAGLGLLGLSVARRRLTQRQNAAEAINCD